MRAAGSWLISLFLGCGAPGPDEAPICAADDAPAGRPVAHLTPPSGWMNDPAGLSYFKGEYHLFYQHDPSGLFTGDVRWGHAASPDLSRWEDRPEALGRDATLGVPFTGSAIVDDQQALCDDDCLVAVFTHALGAGGQQQSVATSSDGDVFSLYEGNPVIPSIGEDDFRDPKVRWYAPTGRWVMVVGAMGRALFYDSPDLVSWRLTGSFGPNAAPIGAWECPDLFPLTGPDGVERWVLKTDVAPGFLQAGPSRYWVGDFDGEQFTPETSGPGLRFDGPDLYAAQSFSGVPDGRSVWVGWMNAWSYAMTAPTDGWRGAQSAPRVLGLAASEDGWVLTQRPIDALEPTCLTHDGDVEVDGEAPILADAGVAYRLDVTLEPGDAEVVGLSLMVGTGSVRVGWDAAAGAVFLDRTSVENADFHPQFASRTEAPVGLDGGRLALTILVDRTSVEVFAGDGRAVITATAYPDEGSRGLAAFSEGGAAALRGLRVGPLPAALPGR